MLALGLAVPVHPTVWRMSPKDNPSIVKYVNLPDNASTLTPESTLMSLVEMVFPVYFIVILIGMPFYLLYLYLKW
jgi:hypothetical protein